ncbi:MAG: TetR/AcrR family transcriptional regulator [Enterococcus sp.]
MARTKEFDEQQVLDKAMRLFWENGYAHTSMQELVDTMGIHRRSIYDTFGDKHALFLKVLHRYEDLLAHEVRELVQPDMPLKEQLWTLFSTTVYPRNLQPKGCLLVNTAAELAVRDEEVYCMLKKSFARSENYIYQLLLTAKETKSFSYNGNLADLASNLHNTWLGLRINIKLNDPKELEGMLTVALSDF